MGARLGTRRRPDKLGNVTPVAFTYKTKKLIAAPGPNGTFVLLDAESLGGARSSHAYGFPD